jgi:peroxiredoxin
MRRTFGFSVLALLAAPALAALPAGTEAPLIKADGAFAGKPYAFDLKRELRSGPVVLYFFPKANTGGCDLEAHLFSEAMPQFKAAHARVIGMSADDNGTLTTFSTAKCAGAFPVATATPEIRRAFDVDWKEHPGLTTRTTYVIEKGGIIVLVQDNLDPTQHVAKALAVAEGLKRK